MRQEEEPGDLGMFIVGAVIGAGLALLFAPEPGTEQRRKLGHWLHEHRGSGHEILVKLKKMLQMRHNGIAVNGHSNPRRHKRA